MGKFADFILKHKAIVIVVFITLMALSVVGFMFVNTNSDLQSYLPDESMTNIGKEELADKFGIKGEASIAVKGASKEYMEALTKTLLDQKDIVNQVAWIGRFDPLNADNIGNNDLTFLRESYAEAEKKYVKTAKDGEKVYIVGIYTSLANTEDASMKVITDLDKILKADLEKGIISEYAMGGGIVNADALLKSSIGEIPKYLAIAVVFIMIVLLITTKSWLEPFIFLLTLGISILLNMGSNVILGTISTITYSASTILQLALAMDYSIFLMHSYYDERAKAPLADSKTLMRRALPKTLKAVAASALTTIGGFIALFTMEFGMGLDLGAVLAKGVLLSLLTVIVLQPVLIVLLDKPIQKTKHKYFTPRLKRTQKYACKYYIPIIIMALLVVVPAFIGQFNVPLAYLTMTKEDKAPSETQQIINASNNQIIVIVPDDRKTNPKDYEKHYDFLEQIKKEIPEIGTSFSVYTILPESFYNGTTGLPSGIITIIENQLRSELYPSFFKNGFALYTFEFLTGTEEEVTYQALDKLTTISNTNFGEGNIHITGLALGAKDLDAITPNDFMKVSLISALIIFLILWLSYKSFSLAAILLFVIELGIWINLSIVTLIGIKINFMSYIIISSIQLGATVDYAILVASKYKQAKDDGELNDATAIQLAVRQASPSVLVSASVLIIACISVFAITSNLIISEITMLIAAGAVMSTFLVMTLLPAILTAKYKIHNKFVNKKLQAAGVPNAVEPPAYLDAEDVKQEELIPQDVNKL